MRKGTFLSSRGPRSLTTRAVAVVVVAAMFGASLNTVARASQPAPARPSSNRGLVLQTDSSPSHTPAGRLRPLGLKVLEGHATEASLWTLFDDRAQTGLDRTAETVRFRIDLARSTWIDGIGVFGAASGDLAIESDAGGVPGKVILPATDLSRGAWQWNRRTVDPGDQTRSLIVTWRGRDASALLRELEIWGRTEAGGASGNSSPVLPDALFQGIPAGAREFRSPDSEQTVALSKTPAAGSGRFRVQLDIDPRALERAFLVYDLQGLPHFAASSRSINGYPALGGFAPSFGAKGGLQVEEIPVASLHKGDNHIQFLPADARSPASYRVSALRVVGIPAGQPTLSDESAREWQGLRDGREATTWSVASTKPAETRRWSFARPTQPRSVDIRLPGRGTGALTFTSVAGGTKGEVVMKLDDLAAGWHRLPLDRLPAGGSLSISLSAGREQRAAVSELVITGSPIPSDEGPRLAVTYPLSGECVNHQVHVRGYVEPAAPATIQVDGTATSVVTASSGDFGFTLSEKEAGGGAGKPFELALRATFAGGARVDKKVSIGGCIERPPLVTGIDGRPQRPTEDLGAPYGATVHAGTATTLSFGGATIEVPPGAVDKDVRLTIRPIARTEVAPLDPGMRNVTPGGQAFRFGPHGMMFKKPLRVTLPYDGKVLPAGDTRSDVRTFFFDEVSGRWEQVGLIGQSDNQMVAVTEHFTDFINATLAMPDHPGTQSINPTSIKDIKLADPAAGVSLIEPPGMNSMGTANLRFPIEVPPGRRGLQPNLAITYDSEKTNGWLGVGWDLQMSSIQIDTRFGAARYDGTDTYQIDGDLLTPIAPPPNASPPAAGEQYFARRAQSTFDWIKRSGTTVGQYAWVVTDKNGTQYFYGEATNGRLADPGAAPGVARIFRWALERVRDTFGNEMKVQYALDAGTNGEPHVQLYPTSISYTSNPGQGLAAAYSVELRRTDPATQQSCDRLDTVIDGRPGFQVMTRCRLHTVEVRLGTTVIRRYTLKYQNPSSASLGKTLLTSIEMSGVGGGQTLYKHDFSYFAAPVTPSPKDRIGLFRDPVVWASSKKADGTDRTQDGLSHASDVTDSARVSVGVELPGIESLSVGFSTTLSSNYDALWSTFDQTGDGIPDGVGSDGLLDIGNIVGANRQTPGAMQGLFLPVPTTHIPGAGQVSHTERDTFTLFGGFQGLFGLTGNVDLTNTARELNFPVDMNGDGYPDDVFASGNGVAVRLNFGSSGFGPAVSWPNYKIDVSTCGVGPLLGNLSRAIGSVTRFIAPFTGFLSVGGGGIAKQVLGTGGQVAATIQRNSSVLWQGTVDKNSPACSPGASNSCSGNLTIPVTAGDRLYMNLRPMTGTGEILTWEPQLNYTSVNGTTLDAATLNLREPEGTSIYKFSQSSDFRTVGRIFIPWTADGTGTVKIEADTFKLTTPDDVRLRIVRENADGSPPAVLYSQTFPGSTPVNIPIQLSGIPVQSEDTLSFQVQSDLPIDPKSINWQPVVTYQTYCRRNPQTDQTTCGAVQCVDDTQGHTTKCTLANDPFPEDPVPTQMFRQQAMVHYPLFRFAPGTPTKTFTATASGPMAITGSVTKSTSTPDRVIVAIQGVNKLFAKKVFEAGETGTASMAVTAPGIVAGEQLFFTVYSDTDVSSAVSWNPVAAGVARPVNFRSRAAGTVRDPSGVGILDVMGGGYHGWSFGEWTAAEPFTESLIQWDPAASVHHFFPAVMTPPVIPIGGVGIPFSFPGVLSDVVHGVGQGIGAVTDVVTGTAKIVKTGVGAGIHVLGGIGSDIIDILRNAFCTTSHPLRVASTSNKGLDIGISVYGAGFNKGGSNSLVDLLDMNGDGMADAVTSTSIQFNSGTQFNTKTTLALPYGNLRSNRHRNLHEGLSASAQVNLTDAQGGPVGFIGGGVGTSYGVTATDVDLIDINGDGLPDHVKADTNGGIKVRLNLGGTKFSSEIVWSSSPWETQGLTGTDGIPAKLFSVFGSLELDTDVLRLEDISTNGVNSSLGGEGSANDAKLGFGFGSGWSTTGSRKFVDLVDINGDGLPDQLLKAPNQQCLNGTTPVGGACMSVKLNLGGRFDTEKQLPMGAWALADSTKPPIVSSTADVLSFSNSGGRDLNLGGKLLLPTPTPGIFTSIAASGSHFHAHVHSNTEFQDIDGDGFVDHVLKQDGSVSGKERVFARLNQGGKTNLLKGVTRPFGGTIEIDYGREGNMVDGFRKIDMPKNHWVMTSVRVGDGRSNFYTNTFDYTILGPDGAANLRAASGFYDRTERENYGFAHVTMIRGRQSGPAIVEGDGSRLERFFHNGDFYRKGAMRAEFEKDPGGLLMRGTLVTLKDPAQANPIPAARTGTFFPAETQRVSMVYEGANITVAAALADQFGLAPKYRVERRTTYDAEGNLTAMEDLGDEQVTTDDAFYTIGYYKETGNHITKVSGVDVAAQSTPGSALRRRTATYVTGKGALETITNVVSGGRIPTTPGSNYSNVPSTSKLTYDAFGNVATFEDPSTYKVKYTYDATAQTHVTRVDDVFLGYFSTAVPDLRFGAPLSVADINGQTESFTFDDFGRVSTVTGPNDQGSSATIQMTYSQQSLTSPGLAWASTKHKDVQHPTDPIETVNFIDGLRRTIQTKKDIEKQFPNGTITAGTTVSGSLTFDSRGRVFTQDQPTFSTDPATTFTIPTNPNRTTLFLYDSLNRGTLAVTPDTAVTSTTYSVGPGTGDALGDGKKWLMTVAVDPMGNLSATDDANIGRRLSYADTRGNRIAVREYNTIGTDSTLTALTTRYTYDILDQLLTVTDAAGKITTASYDSTGKMVQLTSPDAGRTDYLFDLAGNLGAKETPVLRGQSKLIKYLYDFNRLKQIDEPNMADVVYTYGGPTEGGDANGNRAGRIKQVTSEGSTEVRSYDRMGNVNKALTTLPNLSSSNPASVTFTMQYTYDSLGRMLDMTFPNWINSNLTFVSGNGEKVSYAYDRGGNLDRITGHHQTPNPQQTSHPIDFTYLDHIGYDEFEQRNVLTSGNLIANRYTYDSQTRRLTDLTGAALGDAERALNKPAAAFHNLHYDYDKVGNVTRMQNRVSVLPYRNAGVFTGPLDVTYTYDTLYQLRGMTGKYRGHVAYGYQYSDTFTYDTIGNMSRKAQSQDRLVWDNQTVPTNDPTPINQLSGSRFDHNVSGTTYTLDYVYAGTRPHAASTINETLPGSATQFPRSIAYDANGNNTGNSFQGMTRTQVWDEESRLKDVQISGTSIATFRYDDQGERTKKKTLAGDSWYVNQYFTLLQGNRPNKHIFAGDARVATKIDAIDMQTPVVHFYHPDHLGTTSYVTDARQNLVQHERYFAFGDLWRNGEQEETDLSRPGDRREHLFTGKEWDYETGLYYFGARYFDPRTTVWQSPDPALSKYMLGLGVFRSRNLGLYTYSWNNPIVLCDPDGRELVYMDTGGAPAVDVGYGMVNIPNLVQVYDAAGGGAAGAWAIFDVFNPVSRLFDATQRLAEAVGSGGPATEVIASAAETGLSAVAVTATFAGATAKSTPATPAPAGAGMSRVSPLADASAAEIEAAVNAPMTSNTMMSMPAPTGARVNTSGGMMVHELTVPLAPQATNARSTASVATRVRVHSADPTAPAGNNSATGNTVSITQRGGQRRFVPGSGWIRSQNASTDEMNRSHIPIHRDPR